MQIITIGARFCGPPDSGNGGYVAGMLAGQSHAPVRVRLRKPPPLNASLVVHTLDNGGLELKRDDEVIAEAQRYQVELQAPAAPAYVDALDASRSYTGFKHHPYPGCFVCGPQRARGDGLRLFPAPGAATAWSPRRGCRTRRCAAQTARCARSSSGRRSTAPATSPRSTTAGTPAGRDRGAHRPAGARGRILRGGRLEARARGAQAPRRHGALRRRRRALRARARNLDRGAQVRRHRWHRRIDPMFAHLRHHNRLSTSGFVHSQRCRASLNADVRRR